MPKGHHNYQGWTTTLFLDWAGQTGQGVYNLVEIIIARKQHPLLCSKFHFGLKRLCKRFGASRLNQACRRALALDCIQFKSIQSILEKGLDKGPHLTSVPIPETQSHGNLRGAHYYQQHEEKL